VERLIDWNNEGVEVVMPLNQDALLLILDGRGKLKFSEEVEIPC
jgi:hypothetical protein